MFTRHISRQLAAHLDGQLTPAEAEQVRSHLKKCARCRTECEQVRLGMAELEHLPLVEAPAAIWSAIESAAEEVRAPRWRWVLVAAAFVLAVAGIFFWRLARPPVTRWDVLADGKRITAGKWIETGASSREMLKIGEIGSVDVSPNTRLRVITARPGEHRLALLKGEIMAKISAPPKLFFVDTAAGTAVDLGCEYTLNTDERGFGLLRVTKGWVSFESKGLESFVPAGASCRTTPAAGPGVPYFDDATEKLKQALQSGNDTLDTIFAEARVRDTLTLWHLLSRVNVTDRERVFDRMVALTPLPAGVSREKALRLDHQTLEHWREELAWKW